MVEVIEAGHRRQEALGQLGVEAGESPVYWCQQTGQLGGKAPI